MKQIGFNVIGNKETAICPIILGEESLSILFA